MATFAVVFNSICEMDYLPKDPAILVLSVNMLLRDEEFDTLESLCYNFGTEPKDIKNYLHGHHGDGADVLLDRQCCDDLGSCLQRFLHDNRPDRLLLWSWRCHHRYKSWSLRFQAHTQSGFPICCLCLYWSKWSDNSANKRLTCR